jgi:aldose 1-epimerase
VLALTAGLARVTIVPEIGAGLASLCWDGKPVLRCCQNSADASPFDLALNVLAPFSNRISGGFAFAGVRNTVAPNLVGEPYPIHGDACQRKWEVESVTPRAATLSLPQGEIGPFRYSAQLIYQLSEERLEVALSLRNTGKTAQPFGFGFHPWFPRSEQTRISFHADGFWPEDARHLPTTEAPVLLPLGLRFDVLRPLPESWINAGFSGWAGQALVRQGPGAVSVQVAADGLSTALLYAPDPSAGFFCFEPVSHPVDAHNLAGYPGLIVLTSGEVADCRMTLEWS